MLHLLTRKKWAIKKAKGEKTDQREHGQREFPGGPVVRTLHSHCRGPGFNPWSGGKKR